MDLTKYRVKRIIYPHGELQLGEPADVIDKGGYYRIAGTHIIDKFKIMEVEKNGDHITVRTKDKNVILVVDEKE